MTIWTPDLTNISGAKYRAIANAIEGAIQSGELKPGERLPPQRQLSWALEVTVGTITRAYDLVCQRGLATAAVGRGTYINKENFIPPDDLSSPQEMPIELTRASLQLSPNSVQNFIDMAYNIPSLTGQEFYIEQALKELTANGITLKHLDYMRQNTFPDLLFYLRKWLKKSHIEVTEEQIIPCSGAQVAINACLMSSCSAGDICLVEEYTYSSIMPLARALGIQLKPVPFKNNELDVDALEQICKKHSPRAFYIIPTLNNPTTWTLSITARQAIADICQQNNVFIIEDNCFANLLDDPPVPFYTLYPEGTFHMNSFAKMLSPGLRTAIMIAPIGWEYQLQRSNRLITHGSSTISWAIIEIMLKNGGIEKSRQLVQADVRNRYNFTMKILSNAKFYGNPATYNIWLEVPETWTVSSFVNACLELKVLIRSSEDFLAQRTNNIPPYVRLAMGGNLSESQYKAGLKKIAYLLDHPDEYMSYAT